MWCCRLFEGNWLDGSERGFSVGLLQTSVSLSFVLRHRSVDKLDEEELSKATSKVTSPFPVTITSETVIDFCPWCGTQLAKFYKRMLLERIKSRSS
jgi:hypothetical protein